MGGFNLVESICGAIKWLPLAKGRLYWAWRWQSKADCLSRYPQRIENTREGRLLELRGYLKKLLYYGTDHFSPPIRAFRDHFPVKIGRYGARNAPRASILPKKQSPKALQGRLQLVPSVPQGGKLRATCFSASSCQARTLDRARHRPARASASGLGSCLSALRGYDLSISGLFF
jgi:hypothetical protein